MPTKKKLYIGAMSGTSHDAIDVSLVSVNKKAIQLDGFESIKMPKNLSDEISNTIDKNNISLTELGSLDKKIGLMFSKAISRIIEKNVLKNPENIYVGVSGQTIRHEPNLKSNFSMQIGDPNIISAQTGTTVISDFRNMHIAKGGEGAPLVPEFHAELFKSKKAPRVIINIGGISNYTHVQTNGSYFGTDTGPGNSLMDAYCVNRLAIPFDRNGAMAQKGSVLEKELKKMLTSKFFKNKAPKSTGKEIFNFNFIPKSLLKSDKSDVLATLTELTAVSIAKAIRKENHSVKEIYVCGGGIKNKTLMQRLSYHLNTKVNSTSELGFDPQAIESMAFGWLAYKRINNIPSDVRLGNNRVIKALLGSVSRAI
jgi:anhydro-N-acetylmuramic acid kinase